MASWLLMVLSLTVVGAGNGPDCRIVYFTADWCQPCQQMRPALESLAEEGWNVRKVNTDHEPRLVEHFNVKSLPTLVFLSGGREVDRLVGAVPYEVLQQRANRVAARSQSTPGRAGGQAPLKRGGESRQTGESVPQGRSSRAIVRGQSPSSDFSNESRASLAAPNSGGYPLLRSPRASTNEPASPKPRTLKPEQAIARARLATVRIRVDEGRSTAFGTGTIIDRHADEALVLTCGHLFRDMNPDSELTVDLFPQPGKPLTVPAELIDFRAEDEDVGLLSIRLPIAVEPVQVLLTGQQLQVGQPVFSFGCDHGDDPTRRDTTIKQINRYLGAANVEIHGAPAVGRSGGGLFDLQGNLIGVCNAANANEEEGIYAAAPVVYDQLARLGLQRLYQPRPIGLSSQATVRGNNSSQPSSPGTNRMARSGDATPNTTQERKNAPGKLATTGQPTNAQQAGFAWPDERPQLQNAADGSRIRGDRLSDQLTRPGSSENVQVRSASPTQVICIVKGADGQDRVLTIQSPSAELLRAIEAHGGVN